MRKKQIWCTIAAAVFAAGQLAGCGAAQPDAPSEMPAIYTAGTYSGSAQGYGGTVMVEISTDSSSITAVKATGADETPGKGGAALAVLEQQILERQSAEIDGVCGATMTSNGIRAAAAAAIAAAKGEPVPETQPEAQTQEGGETVSAGIEENEEID